MKSQLVIGMVTGSGPLRERDGCDAKPIYCTRTSTEQQRDVHDEVEAGAQLAVETRESALVQRVFVKLLAECGALPRELHCHQDGPAPPHEHNRLKYAV